MSPGWTEACADDTRWPQSHRVIRPQPLLCSHHVRGLPGVRPRARPSSVPGPPPQLQRGLQSDSRRFSRGRFCIRPSHDPVRPGGSGDGASFLRGVCVLGPGEADGELLWTVDMLLSGCWQPQDGKQTSVFYGAPEEVTRARVRSEYYLTLWFPKKVGLLWFFWLCVQQAWNL